MFTVKTSDNSPFIKRTTPHFIASTPHHPLILPSLHLHFAGIWSIYSIFPFFFWQVLYQLLFSIHGILIFGRLSVFIDIGVTVLAHEHKEHTKNHFNIQHPTALPSTYKSHLFHGLSTTNPYQNCGQSYIFATFITFVLKKSGQT